MKKKTNSKTINAFMIAGVTSGSGKTTVTKGIISMFKERGYKVQPFKLGPDYIDSGHHSELCGRPCINLDKYLMTHDASSEDSSSVLKDHFNYYSSKCDVSIVEAVGGIYDDWDCDGNSPGQIAVDLDLPVILVVDGYSYCQTLGIMINPLVDYLNNIKIHGIIINKVNSHEQFEKICLSIRKDYQYLIIGYLSNESKLFLEERHLGLLTASESVSYETLAFDSSKLNNIFSKSIEFQKLECLKAEVNPDVILFNQQAEISCRIAVAKDEAFSFYYYYNIQLLQSLGAEIVYFSPLHDEFLPPDIDLIYLGGGFPEVHAHRLEKNYRLKTKIKFLAENDFPIYAECGGLLYLSNSISEYKSNTVLKMCNVFDFDSTWGEKLALCYANGVLTNDCIIGSKGDMIKGHIFHQTAINNSESVTTSAKLESNTSHQVSSEGYSYKNVYASYLHIHFAGCPYVAESLISKARTWHYPKFGSQY